MKCAYIGKKSFMDGITCMCKKTITCAESVWLLDLYIMGIQVFWDVTLCHSASGSWSVRGPQYLHLQEQAAHLDPEYVCTNISWNTETQLSNIAVGTSYLVCVSNLETFPQVFTLYYICNIELEKEDHQEGIRDYRSLFKQDRTSKSLPMHPRDKNMSEQNLVTLQWQKININSLRSKCFC
jgi:hypothetical protein